MTIAIYFIVALVNVFLHVFKNILVIKSTKFRALAGCPLGGVILDPFMGTGTTAMVARMYGRSYIGFEINPDFVDIARQKIIVTPNIFYQ